MGKSIERRTVGFPVMSETVISEIEDIKVRLGEIADEREHLPEESEDRREELLAEEHRLESRLTVLEDEVVEEDSGGAQEEASKQADLTRSPQLPEDPENR